MKKYVGIKFVEAERMSAQDAAAKGYRVPEGATDGYEVVYEEGYKSWCPADVFEKHNREVKDREFAQTAADMLSADYKERFKAEYRQARIRYDRLHRTIVKCQAGTLEFEPACPLALLIEQAKSMRAYMQVLEVRAEVEDIPLD